MRYTHMYIDLLNGTHIWFIKWNIAIPSPYVIAFKSELYLFIDYFDETEWNIDSIQFQYSERV